MEDKTNLVVEIENSRATGQHRGTTCAIYTKVRRHGYGWGFHRLASTTRGEHFEGLQDLLISAFFFGW